MRLELILFIIGALLFLAGCLTPTRWLPPLPNDKLLHFVAFAALTLLALRIAQGSSSLALWLACLLVGGWLVECLQHWIPGRKFCWRDMAANTAGILFATLFFAVLPKLV